MPKSLAQKVAEIARSCAYIQKDAKNDFHKYRYASAAAVLAKVNEAMSEHGVCSTVEPEIISEADSPSGRLVTVKIRLTIHDAESDATLTTAGIGCGQDKGDKAPMKAQTAALKYAWMLALNISTGDDPEADEETDKRASGPRPAALPTRVPTEAARRGPDDTEATAQPKPTPIDRARAVAAEMESGSLRTMEDQWAQLVAECDRLGIGHPKQMPAPGQIVNVCRALAKQVRAKGGTALPF